MTRRWKNLCALLFAVALVIDLAGFDCLRPSSSDPCSSSVEVCDTDTPVPDCLCCSVAHARPETALSGTLDCLGLLSRETENAVADGVGPVPYRPPLANSLL